ncbi:hypothetical protein DFH28DRAFT_1222662 [Melampsora americana]|nr:hypothetical protein DFH28DRAFT_1222662 [Melampsora americana]
MARLCFLIFIFAVLQTQFSFKGSLSCFPWVKKLLGFKASPQSSTQDAIHYKAVENSCVYEDISHAQPSPKTPIFDEDLLHAQSSSKTPNFDEDLLHAQSSSKIPNFDEDLLHAQSSSKTPNFDDIFDAQSSLKTPIVTDIKEPERVWNEDHKLAMDSWNKLFKTGKRFLCEFKGLENDYCQVLKSKPEVLVQKLVVMWNHISQNDTASQTTKHLAILHILRNFGENHTLSPMACQVILSQLGKMSDGGMMVFCPRPVETLMKNTKELYVKKLTEHIKKLTEDSEIIEFVSMHKSLEGDGFQLVRNWAPDIEKEIMLLWTSSITSYRLSSPEIRGVVEAQVAYISLIEKNYDHLKHGFTSANINRDGLYETLNRYQKEIVDSIDSLDEDQMIEYRACQEKLSRFAIQRFQRGSKTPSDSASKTILKFWTTYMSLYIEIRANNMLKDYGMLVENLAMSHPETISKYLDGFLVKESGLEGSEPLVIQFVHYLHGTVKSQRSEPGKPRTPEETAELLDIFEKCEDALTRLEKPN